MSNEQEENQFGSYFVMEGVTKKKRESAAYISFAISFCFSAIVCSFLFGIEAAAILAASPAAYF